MIKYDVNYYYNLLKIHTGTARQISDIRWKFIADNISFNNKRPVVLDYGCGVSWFSAFKPSIISDENIDTFDIMSVPQTGIRHKQYDLLTLWDVLEHIPDFTELEPILKNTDFIALSLPIKPPEALWSDWKHFKPGEHLHYYTVGLLDALFKVYGFNLLIDTMAECPPRKDIHSMVFAKELNNE